MNKNTPLARAVRTFLWFMVAVTTAAGFADAVKDQDVRLTGTLLILGIIGGLLAAGIAYLWAVLPGLQNAHSPFTRALATFVQSVAGGLGALGLAELTKAAAITFAAQLWHVLFVAFMAGLASLVANAAEDAGGVERDPRFGTAPPPPTT